MASGDLTDAKDRDHLGSRQYEQEWKIYHDILESSQVRNKTLWMDIRGNHGNFDGFFLQIFVLSDRIFEKSDQFLHFINKQNIIERIFTFFF